MERFLELPLAVFRREDAEIFRGVVAFASANVHAGGNRIDFHVHAPPRAVIRRVRAVISHQVVSRRIVLHALKNLAEISHVKKGAPSGVSRKRRQRIARILARLALRNDGRAREHRVAARRARAGVAPRRRRQQPARIDAVNGNVRAIRGIGRGDELRAIFLAGLRDAAGELNDGFLAGNSFENFTQRLDGGELAVRIENIEFRVVGGERRAGVFGDGGFPIRRRRRIGQLRERRFVAGHQGVDGLLEQFAIVREIRDDFQRVAEGDDGDEVRGSHLLLKILLRGACRAQQILRLQRSEVEEHHDHAVIAHHRLDFLGRSDGSQREP